MPASFWRFYASVFCRYTTDASYPFDLYAVMFIDIYYAFDLLAFASPFYLSHASCLPYRVSLYPTGHLGFHCLCSSPPLLSIPFVLASALSNCLFYSPRLALFISATHITLILNDRLGFLFIPLDLSLFDHKRSDPFYPTLHLLLTLFVIPLVYSLTPRTLLPLVIFIVYLPLSPCASLLIALVDGREVRESPDPPHVLHVCKNSSVYVV